MRKHWNLGLLTGLAVLAGICLVIQATDAKPTTLDTFRGVPVYDNGPIVTFSHGRHYAADGYYFGQKWQCVEFVKRFFYKAFNHRMPDVWGHAKDFFDQDTPAGKLNKKRGLLQYRNGGSVAPQPGDLVVFTNGLYGHVAIVSAVRSNQVEIIQQNIYGHPRDGYSLKSEDGRWVMGESYQPAGWLRVPLKR